MDYSIEAAIIATTARYYGMEDTESLHFICQREAAKAKTNSGKVDGIKRGFNLIRPGHLASEVGAGRASHGQGR